MVAHCQSHAHDGHGAQHEQESCAGGQRTQMVGVPLMRSHPPSGACGRRWMREPMYTAALRGVSSFATLRSCSTDVAC